MEIQHKQVKARLQDENSLTSKFKKKYTDEKFDRLFGQTKIYNKEELKNLNLPIMEFTTEPATFDYTYYSENYDTIYNRNIYYQGQLVKFKVYNNVNTYLDLYILFYLSTYNYHYIKIDKIKNTRIEKNTHIPTFLVPSLLISEEKGDYLMCRFDSDTNQIVLLNNDSNTAYHIVQTAKINELSPYIHFCIYYSYVFISSNYSKYLYR